MKLNKLCKKCEKTCKQFHYATVVYCPQVKIQKTGETDFKKAAREVKNEVY